MEDFMVNMNRYSYLYMSEEFHAWVRSTPQKDLFSQLKEKTKAHIKQMSAAGFDSELIDRVERYESILLGLQKTPEYEKQVFNNAVLIKMVEKTGVFASINVSWLKNMANNL